MSRTRKKLALRNPPLTVGRPALLAQGSDAEFRGLIHDLIAYGHKLDGCRDAFAAIAGISGVQYEIVMLVSRADGLSIGEVAARLHRSGAFITIEANKLAAAGILEKAPDPRDGRRVLLKNTNKSLQLLERWRRTSGASTTCCSSSWMRSASASCARSPPSWWRAATVPSP